MEHEAEGGAGCMISSNPTLPTLLTVPTAPRHTLLKSYNHTVIKSFNPISSLSPFIPLVPVVPVVRVVLVVPVVPLVLVVPVVRGYRL